MVSTKKLRGYNGLLPYIVFIGWSSQFFDIHLSTLQQKIIDLELASSESDVAHKYVSGVDSYVDKLDKHKLNSQIAAQLDHEQQVCAKVVE